MSTEQHSPGDFLLNIDKLKDEEIDANDLEVALINESFEEQQKHSQLFCDMKLKSIFYGENEAADAPNANHPQQLPFSIIEIVEEEKVELTPLQFLPNNSPYSDFDEDDAERGRQLDQELGRMMLDEEDKYLFSDSPPPLLTPKEKESIFYCDPFAFIPGQSSFFSSFESQTEQDTECADAEAIAIDVIQSLFADEQCTDHSSTSYDDNDVVVSASILKILQDDDEFDSISEEMEDDPKMERSDSEIIKDKQPFEDDYMAPPPPPRNDSLQTISSPMSTSCLSADEQTVPVIEHWEELDNEPIAAEKMSIDARAMLKKIRAERKATQL